MRIIGLTGGIGSGKSTASSYLKKQGFAVVDADQIAREIVEPGSPVLQQLSEAFGCSILQADGSLDRKKLGTIVFSDSEKKEVLDRVMHGEIQRIMEAQIRDFEGSVLFLDVPLLFETGMDDLADEVWVVDTEDNLRIDRVVLRDGLSAEEVRDRIRRQLPSEEKRKRADSIISNSGTVEELYSQVDQLMGDIK